MTAEAVAASYAVAATAQASQVDPPPGKVDISGLEILKYVPDIPRELFSRKLGRQNLTLCITSIAKLAPLFVPEGVRNAFGLGKMPSRGTQRSRRS